MKETMGQIIRRLRKEQNLTQDELAELLGVTFQAVSKWENDSGMPDISQVVPIAHVFGVSTDILFGTFGTYDADEVLKIIHHSEGLLSRPLSAANLFEKYRALLDGLKLYPNNAMLLLHCLETGCTLAYPENAELYDAEHADEIYHDCIRFANLILSYNNNVSDIMRAHMIMVSLHSAYGNFEAARHHAEHFPHRADFNFHVMQANCAHWMRDYAAETKNCQYSIFYYLEAMLNTSVQLARSYFFQDQYKDAAITLETSLALIHSVFKENEVSPPLHHREYGDLYMLLAEIYLKDNHIEKAISYLEKMVDYDLNDYARIDVSTPVASPLLNLLSREICRSRSDRLQNLITKLTDSRFDALKVNDRYQRLIELVNK